jgi:hypothetical protein
MRRAAGLAGARSSARRTVRWIGQLSRAHRLQSSTHTRAALTPHCSHHIEYVAVPIGVPTGQLLPDVPVHTMTESPTCGINSAPVGVCTTVVPLISNWDRFTCVCMCPSICNKRDLIRLPIGKQMSLVEIGPRAGRESDQILVAGSEAGHLSEHFRFCVSPCPAL